MARRALPAAAAVAAIAALGGTAYGGYRFVTTSSRFAITDVVIRGASHLDAEPIRTALVGGNVFATNLGRVVRDVRTNPWIETAEARRILPHTIEIVVHERSAAAVAELGGLYLVDASGHPFKRAQIAAGEGQGLPVITGLDRATYLASPDAVATQIKAALAALAAWKADPTRPAIGELHLDPRGALTLSTYDRSTSIHVGSIDAELDARLQTFDAAWAELTDAEREHARAIHLDARPDHVTVAFAKN